jgi:hypothetical protein
MDPIDRLNNDHFIRLLRTRKTLSMLVNEKDMPSLLGLSEVLVRGRVFKATDHSIIVSAVLSSSQR